MLLSQLTNIQLIQKGWSGDRKYRAETTDGRVYLLRTSPAELSGRKRQEFEQMQRVAALGIPMCAPLEFGFCDEGVYSVQSWVEGEDAELVLPRLPEQEATRIGLEAGRLLRKIHTLPAPEGVEDWEPRFNRKIDRKILQYRNCELKYENGTAFVNCLQENRALLHGRPQSFQHGDYHIGNMMLSGGALVIIDFNRFDFGDPWEEFNRIVWSAQKCPPFARGTVDGYFDGNPPEQFWRLLMLYISSNTLGSLPWATGFGQAEICTMRRQAREVLQWFDKMQNPVPTWYRERSAQA